MISGIVYLSESAPSKENDCGHVVKLKGGNNTT